MEIKYSENNSAYCEYEESLKEKLEDISIKTDRNSPLKAYVCDYITDTYSDNEEIEGFFKDLAYGGCISGIISDLCCYSETDRFYQKFCHEIESLKRETETDLGTPLKLEEEHYENSVSWFAFEETAYRLSSELKLDI